MIHRLGRLHLHDAMQPAARARVGQDQVGVGGAASRADRDLLEGAHIDSHLESAPPFGLELSQYPVVLQLLANWA